MWTRLGTMPELRQQRSKFAMEKAIGPTPPSHAMDFPDRAWAQKYQMLNRGGDSGIPKTPSATSFNFRMEHLEVMLMTPPLVKHTRGKPAQIAPGSSV